MKKALNTFLKITLGIVIPFVVLSFNLVFAVENDEELRFKMFDKNEEVVSEVKNNSDVKADKVLKKTKFIQVESQHSKVEKTANEKTRELNLFMKKFEKEILADKKYEDSLIVNYGKAGSDYYGTKVRLDLDGIDFERSELSLEDLDKVYNLKNLLRDYKDLKIEVVSFYYLEEEDTVRNKSEAWNRSVVAKDFVIAEIENYKNFDARIKPVVLSVDDDMDDMDNVIEFVVLKR